MRPRSDLVSCKILSVSVVRRRPGSAWWWVDGEDVASGSKSRAACFAMRSLSESCRYVEELYIDPGTTEGWPIDATASSTPL